MSWDRIAIAQHFLRKANSIHPEDSGQASYEKQLAAQDVYYECYVTCFSRDSLMSFLTAALSGNVKIPEDVDEKKYREAYIAEAKRIHAEYEKTG